MLMFRTAMHTRRLSRIFPLHFVLAILGTTHAQRIFSIEFMQAQMWLKSQSDSQYMYVCVLNIFFSLYQITDFVIIFSYYRCEYAFCCCCLLFIVAVHSVLLLSRDHSYSLSPFPPSSVSHSWCRSFLRFPHTFPLGLVFSCPLPHSLAKSSLSM